MQKNIDAIFRKYGEAVFRMSVTTLFDYGKERYMRVDVEKHCKDIMENTPENAIITGEMLVKITRCAAELAKEDLWDILKYIQLNISVDNAKVHPGVFIDFRDNRTGGSIMDCVAAPETDECDIEEAVEAIQERVSVAKSECRSVSYPDVIRDEFKKKGIILKNLVYDHEFYL